jgi:hypothetical protein
VVQDSRLTIIASTKPAGVSKSGSTARSSPTQGGDPTRGPVGHVVAPVVYYFPRKDVKMERLVRTEHQTYCPFKGQASYYSMKDGPENAVWTYEQPYDEMLAIKEHLAFYPDKVEIVPG